METALNLVGSAIYIYNPQGKALFLNKMTVYEFHVLKETLARHQGNIPKAAKELGLARQNLQYRMRKYGIRD